MNYISIQNIDSLEKWVKQALKIKKKPLKNKKLGKNKTLGMLAHLNILEKLPQLCLNIAILLQLELLQD